MKLISKILADRRLRYLISGGTSAALEYLVFILLQYTLSMLIFSNIASFLFGLIVSFLLHRVWSFKGAHTTGVSKQALTYTLLALVNMGLSSVIIYGLVYIARLDPWIAKFCVMALVVSWNYVILNRIIFKRNATE